MGFKGSKLYILWCSFPRRGQCVGQRTGSRKRCLACNTYGKSVYWVLLTLLALFILSYRQPSCISVCRHEYSVCYIFFFSDITSCFPHIFSSNKGILKCAGALHFLQNGMCTKRSLISAHCPSEDALDSSLATHRRLWSALCKHAYSNILKILPPKNEIFQIKNNNNFHISAQKHRLLVLVRTDSAAADAVLTSTNSLCFWAEKRKIMYTL